MPKSTFEFKVVTPTFLSGADPGEVEWRTPSIRGQLRYWFRAIAGANTGSHTDVWTAESTIFGSTKQSSCVSIRFYGDSPETSDERVVPHNPRKSFTLPAIKPKNIATLEFVTRPGIEFPAGFWNSVKTWALLGGIGKRSRRMFGGFVISGKPWSTPPNPSSYQREIQSVLSNAIHNQTRISTLPSFPILHEQHSCILVGHKLYSAHLDAVKDLYDLLRGDYRSVERMFGYAGYDTDDREYIESLRKQGKRKELKEFRDSLVNRRASSLIAQIRPQGKKYFVVLTMLRSAPDQISSQQRMKWEVINRFMRDAQQTIEGEVAWGGEFK